MSCTLSAEINQYMPNTESSARGGFDHFGLDAKLMQGIQAAGFINPRPIQLDTIPAGLDGRDVLGLAQTGTGKTAAFALPLLQRIMQKPRKGPCALVLAPTRELANQIAEETRTLARFTPVKLVTIYGGVSIRNQVDQLRRRPQLVVGCPGRVLDLLQQGILRLDHIETLVIDEADHMFDMGFMPDIKKILAALPKKRQNLLFSATMPKEIRGLADDLLQTPKVVELSSSAPVETIDHALVMISEQQKRNLLEHVLRRDDCNSAIVFTRTKHRAKRLAEQLSKAGHRAVGIQGNLSQARRDQAMRGFRTRKYDILVATDIVARGIDVSGVSHVINFDVPNTPEAYTHRIGRTGRAELEGIACTFVTGSDHSWLRATERMIGSKIPRKQVEGFEAEAEPRPQRNSAPRGHTREDRPAGKRWNKWGNSSGRGRSRRGRA
ncbi:DEAD/DEAH box helicase [bacterium]|nr:DEAD/DEAH box helicase [bacterium]